jgi:tetratricopeptide (TPR) repeat protein
MIYSSIGSRHINMFEFLSKFVPRSVVVVLLGLTLAAVAAFAAVTHLVNRFNANQQSRGRKLYAAGLAVLNSNQPVQAIEKFRAALACDRGNPQYQLNLARALGDTGRLDEAQSYLESLWRRAPEDGTVNLALARVTARRGSTDDTVRYYHNAMYGVWADAPDENRRNASLELIEFLLQKSAWTQAQSELMALAAFLPPDPTMELRTAELLGQAGNYSDALIEYEKVLRTDRENAAALAGAGEVAYRAGRYRTARRYLQGAVDANSADSNARDQLTAVNQILEADPFMERISEAERNRRILSAFAKAGERLSSCARKKGVDLTSATVSSQFPLATFESRWLAAKRRLPQLRFGGEADLPDAIMDVVFQIEQETATECGEPTGIDQALLMISRNRGGADQ